MMEKIVTVISLIAANAIAGEVDQFGLDFFKDGFTNRLSRYGYGRSYARTATVAFVEQVVRDLVTNTVKRRIPEYVCVVY